MADPKLDNTFHLKTGSPCIDKGLTIKTLKYDIDGGKRLGPFDIGADEYGVGKQLAIPPDNGGTGRRLSN